MLTRAVACAVFLLALPGTALAEWHFTPLLGTTFLGRTSLPDPEAATGKPHKTIGGSVVALGGGTLGVEGMIEWTPGFFEAGNQDLVQSSRTLAVLGNIMLTAPRRWTEYTLRPFVSGGFGLLQASRTEGSALHSVFTSTANTFGYNIGGGGIGFFTQGTGVRFDLRYYNNLTEPDVPSIGPVNLRYMTISVGVVLRR